jgi:hypothetical protein
MVKLGLIWFFRFGGRLGPTGKFYVRSWGSPSGWQKDHWNRNYSLRYYLE